MLQGKRIIASVTNDLFHDRRMIRICNSLVEEGAEVILVGVKRKKSPGLPDQLFEQRRLWTGFQKGILFYSIFNIRLFLYLLFHRFDLVIAADLDTILPGTIISFIKGKKKLYDAHEFFTEVPELEEKTLKKALWSGLAKICIGRYNMTVSESLVKVLEDKYGRKFELIRNLPLKLSTAEREPKNITTESNIKLIYIGYLNEGRGLESAIEMMKMLPDRFELMLLGRGDIEQALKEKVKALKLSERVSFPGWVMPEDLPGYLDRAHIGLNLLESRSKSYYYSLANKTFDYLQFGLPAIHMNFPEYKTLQKEFTCLLLTDNLEPENLADLLTRLIDNKDEYLKLSNSALFAFEKLNWGMEKHKIKDFVAKILNVKP